ncbi:MAG: anthranilate synthase component I family protein, partial [Candidatus Diapherotrites archaeon]|nr:anthranilate synthase component I family protein [Candidatus Diapherotrites archaeon]
LILDSDEKEIEKEIQRCLKDLQKMEDELDDYKIEPELHEPMKGKIKLHTSKQEFMQTVEKLKKHIVEGDIFQVVPSLVISADLNSSPLEVYRNLRKISPTPYMFYFNTEEGTLLGASPEMQFKISEKEGKKIIETRPIAGTKPRGLVNGILDKDLDSRFETELILDEKEIAEHTMLVDLARNDLAKVCKTGTRFAKNLYSIEKYSFVQHLVSTIEGELKDGLNAFNAYIALANAGTLTGAPKIKAMELIRKYEGIARGYYGGTICYITPAGEFNSAIVIRAIRIKDKKIYMQAGAGIVYDSNPEKEFEETQNKAMAGLKAVKQTGGANYD